MPFSFDVLQNTRKSLKSTLENTSLDKLNKVPEGFNNNLIWNIGHILVTEQVLVYKLSGLEPKVSSDLINKYKKGTKPEGEVSLEEVNEIKALLESCIENTIKDYNKGLFKDFNEYTVSTTGNTLTTIDDSLEFVLFHEGMHMGVIMALKKLV